MIQFVYPAFLFALVALAIPIIVHLFSFRRYRTVQFPSVRFLREIKEETASRSRLKHLLVLATRMLALAFLVLVFAQPFIPAADQDEARAARRTVSIYIDNSFSMEARGSDVALLDLAREKGREIIQAYGAEDRFQVLTNTFEGRHQRLVSQNEALGLLSDIEITPESKKLSEVYARQKQAVRDEEDVVLYQISDFQEAMVDIVPDTQDRIRFIRLSSDFVRNLTIDSCWLTAPVRLINQQNDLVVRLRNFGDQDIADRPIQLRLNGEVKALGNVTVAAGGESTDTLRFKVNRPGWAKAEVQITDFPVQFDDRYFLAFHVDSSQRILAIGERSNRYLKALEGFRNLIKVDERRPTAVNYAGLGSYDLVVIHDVQRLSTGLLDELAAYVEGGGKLLLAPGENSDVASYNGLSRVLCGASFEAYSRTKVKVDWVNQQSPFYQDAFDAIPRNPAYPTIQKYYPIASANKVREEPLLRLTNGDIFLARYPAGQGLLYMMGAPADTGYSNFPRNSLFVVTMIQMTVSGQAGRLAYTIGRDRVLTTETLPKGPEENLIFRSDFGTFIPGQRPSGRWTLIEIRDQIREPGHYELALASATQGKMFAFNHDRLESNPKALSKQELRESYASAGIDVIDAGTANLGLQLRQLTEGRQLWRLCVILALLFLALEIIFLRLL